MNLNNNRVIVRTDIIDPHVYLDIELQYKELIEVLNSCGGYALYQQIYKYYGEKTKGFREIKKLEEINLVNSEQYSNCKYVYLKYTALKYLKYRDVEVIESTYVNQNTPKPSFRPLFNSIYSFEHYLSTKDIINTELSIKVLRQFIEKVRHVLKVNRIPNIHLVKCEKDDFLAAMESKIKILGERNGIYLVDIQDAPELQNTVLKFVWYDFNQVSEENTLLKTIRMISRFLNEFGVKNQLNCCKFSIEVFTPGEQRKQILERLAAKALKTIESRNEYHLKNTSAAKSKFIQVVSGFAGVNYRVYADIEGYTRVSSRGDKEFQFAEGKTIERLEQLRQIIKGGEVD